MGVGATGAEIAGTAADVGGLASNLTPSAFPLKDLAELLGPANLNFHGWSKQNPPPPIPAPGSTAAGTVNTGSGSATGQRAGTGTGGTGTPHQAIP